MTKVIHVHLLAGRKNYYFGSISAIFDVLTPDQIGYTKNSLLHAGLSDGGCLIVSVSAFIPCIIQKKQ